jgi:hypothetical protein
MATTARMIARLSRLAGGRALNEAAVDLDRREAQVAEVGERGIAGAEIVERNPAAERHDLFERGAGGGGIAHEDASVTSISSRWAGSPLELSAPTTLAAKSGVEQLLARDVDRDLDVAWPLHRLAAGLAQHPFADRHDQPGVLGQRMNFTGLTSPCSSLFQRSSASKLTMPSVLRIDHRLIVEDELVASPARGAARIPACGVPRHGRAATAHSQVQRRRPLPWSGRAQGRRCASAFPPSIRRADRSPSRPLAPT